MRGCEGLGGFRVALRLLPFEIFWNAFCRLPVLGIRKPTGSGFQAKSGYRAFGSLVECLGSVGPTGLGRASSGQEIGLPSML